MSMTDVVLVVLLVLLGIVAGVLLPTIVQAKRTLRSAERWFEGTGRKVDRLAEDAGAVVPRLNHAGIDFEGSVQDAKGLLASLREIADGAAQLKGAVNSLATVGSVLGPAIAEGLRAAFAPEPEEEDQEVEGDPRRPTAVPTTRQGGTS